MTAESTPPPDREQGSRAEPPAPPTSDLPPPPSESLGWVQRVGEACAFASVVSLLVAVPTAMRSSGAPGGGFVTAWLVGAAVLLPVLAVAIGLVRAAGRGFRALVTPSSARGRGLGVAMWFGFSVPALVVLGAALRAMTNHRGLGGATFGVVGLLLVVGAALVAFRLVETGQRLVDRGRSPKLVGWAGVGLALAPLVLCVVPLLALGRTEGATSAVLSALLDGAIAVVIVSLVATLDLGEPARRAARLGGVPAAALLVMGGSATIESSTALADAMRAGGGLAATLLGALERWSDRDADGHGAHFGGGDCDEGDPRKHPRQVEVEGDGIDQNCDGADGAGAPTHGENAGRESDVALSPVAPDDATRAASLQTRAPTDAPVRPDVVLVTMDAIRADRTSTYGFDRATTPALTALTARGTRFDRAYAPASDTQRALMPVVTGLRLSQTPRGRGEWPTLYPEALTLAEQLKAAGYVTGAVSSFTWLRRDRGYEQGFDYFEEAFRKDHPERGVTGPHAVVAARAILERFRTEARPTFLWVHLFDAHAEHVPHDGIDFGSNAEGRYLAEVAFVDRQLGALVDAVAAMPGGDETVWIVHGSHGLSLGEHDYVGHGAELFEPLVRVPLVVVSPGGAPCTVEGPPVSTLDIAPTLLELAGAEADPAFEGRSLVEALCSSATRPPGERSDRPAVYVRGPRKAALVEGSLKIIRTLRDKGKPRHVLFDLDADPGERKDLSEERSADLARLIAALDAREALANDQEYRRKRPVSEGDGHEADDDSDDPVETTDAEGEAARPDDAEAIEPPAPEVPPPT